MPLNQVLLLVKAASSTHSTLDFLSVDFPLPYPNTVDHVVAFLVTRRCEHLVVSEALQLLVVSVINELSILHHVGFGKKSGVGVNSEECNS